MNLVRRRRLAIKRYVILRGGWGLVLAQASALHDLHRGSLARWIAFPTVVTSRLNTRCPFSVFLLRCFHTLRGPTCGAWHDYSPFVDRAPIGREGSRWWYTTSRNGLHGLSFAASTSLTASWIAVGRISELFVRVPAVEPAKGPLGKEGFKQQDIAAQQRGLGRYMLSGDAAPPPGPVTPRRLATLSRKHDPIISHRCASRSRRLRKIRSNTGGGYSLFLLCCMGLARNVQGARAVGMTTLTLIGGSYREQAAAASVACLQRGQGVGQLQSRFNQTLSWRSARSETSQRYTCRLGPRVDPPAGAKRRSRFNLGV